MSEHGDGSKGSSMSESMCGAKGCDGRSDMPAVINSDRPRACGIVRAAAEPNAVPTSTVLGVAGSVLEAIWTGDTAQIDELCTQPVRVTLTSAEHAETSVRPSDLLVVGRGLSAIEVHLDHVLYLHPSVAAWFRIAARAGVGRTPGGATARDITVRGALFGLLDEHCFAELHLICDSGVGGRGSAGVTGVPDNATR